MEDLHQMRVSTRQLRTILRAAQPLLVQGWGEPLRTELGWLGEMLGGARDLDVQIKYFKEELTALDLRDRRGLERFVARLCMERDKVQQTLVGELQSPRYLELVRKLMQAAQDPAVVVSTVTVCDIAATEFKKLRKAMRSSRKPAKESRRRGLFRRSRLFRICSAYIRMRSLPKNISGNLQSSRQAYERPLSPGGWSSANVSAATRHDRHLSRNGKS